MHLRRLAILALLITTPTLSAADWPRFRGPAGLGTADDKGVPVAFAPENFLWKTPIPGKGNSSPIVSKGKVFLQTATESNRSLVCIDAVTGKILWGKAVRGAKAHTNEKNSLASSTPTADGERVYLVFWDGKNQSLTAWDYDGKQLWDQDLGGFISQHGPGLSPIVVGDKVIVNVDQDGLAEVKAFDAKTGALAWTKSRTAYRASYTTPFVRERDGKTEVIVSSTAGITAYDPKDGAAMWNWTWVWKADPNAPALKGKAKGGPGGPLRHVAGPILHDGLIFAVSGDGGGDRHMVAIKADNSGDVTDTALVWEKKRGTSYVPMVLARGEHLFWVTDKENLAVCVEAKTGKEVWNVRLGGRAAVTASPVMIDGKIYSVCEDGTVYVFAAEKEFDLLAKNELKEAVYASPAIADGRLYIRGTSHLFCIGAKK